MTFQEKILEGIPSVLPPHRERDNSISHAPKRKDILTDEEKKLALKMHFVILTLNFILN